MGEIRRSTPILLRTIARTRARAHTQTRAPTRTRVLASNPKDMAEDRNIIAAAALRPSTSIQYPRGFPGSCTQVSGAVY